MKLLLPLRFIFNRGGRLRSKSVRLLSVESPSSSMAQDAAAGHSQSVRGEEEVSYESAITALNTLQSNSAVIQKIRKERQKHVHLNLPLTTQYLERSGMSMEDLDSLKIIHVSGTKGKGSTCAFTESILRQHGLRTGFYSSPHLVSATERVRLDGQPISKEKFAIYFWDVYNKVCRGRGAEDRPPYFQFLTLLAFNIFWREKVEVAIIEVGIGGEYDCTNIIRKPVVTGITALGLDHVNILGNTISEIAWHKAGIMKPGVATYIDGNQQEAALQTLAERSVELGAELCAKVPSLQEYNWGRYPMRLGLYGQVQQQNASLALALSNHFLASQGLRSPLTTTLEDLGDTLEIKSLMPFKISVDCALGLRLTDWPGRTQLIDHGRVLYMLDGAHTEESIQACRSWFSLASKVAIKNPNHKIFKVMLFNTSGERDPRVLMQPFTNSELDLVIFCTNLSGLDSGDTLDQQNFTTTEKIQLARCNNHLYVWTKMQSSASQTLRLLDTEPAPPAAVIPGIIIPSISEALNWITQGSDPSLAVSYQAIPDHPVPQDLQTADEIQILITGSLHLVGGALACIEPGGGLPVRRVDRELVNQYYRLNNNNGLNSVPGMM